MAEQVMLDVRPDIEAGREPFGKIMAAVKALEPNQELVIINSFEPRPLYSVLGKRGFEYRTEQRDDGSWYVTFYLAK